MKKIFSLALTAVLFISACGMTAFAGHKGHHEYNCRTEKCSFTDSDGDGLCDNCGKACKFIDKDNDGLCDNCGQKCKFVDKDDDGLCDNCGEKRPERKSGNNCRKNSGKGHKRGCHKSC